MGSDLDVVGSRRRRGLDLEILAGESFMGALDGKVAVVTGASKGIGAGIALAMGRQGASVVVNYSTSKAGADRVVGEIMAEGGKAIAIQADVSQAADVARLFAETVKEFGLPSVLVNNAAVFSFGPFTETMREETFHWMFNVNVLGPMLTTLEALKNFSPSGGSIINIGSVVGSHARATTTVYAATKGAIDSFTRALALELGERNIRVNAIAPGHTQTEGTTTIFADEVGVKLAAESPFKRMGTPADIGRVAAFLASDESSWITGEVIRVGGGVI
jgi:3-oxoacyl-[acyl-carrier protein] reductase